MLSSTIFLVAFSILAVCSAKSIEITNYKCAYSRDSSMKGGDLSRCDSCDGYSEVALLQTDNWIKPIYLFCLKTTTRLNPQNSQAYDNKLVS